MKNEYRSTLIIYEKLMEALAVLDEASHFMLKNNIKYYGSELQKTRRQLMANAMSYNSKAIELKSIKELKS